MPKPIQVSSKRKVFGRSRDPMLARKRSNEASRAVVTTRRTKRLMPAKLISVQQFCAAYALGRTRTYELLNSGEIEAIKSGHRTLILMESVEAWLERLQPFGAHK